MNVYPVSPGAASSAAEGGEVMVAVRLADLATPLRNGRLPGGDCRSALVTGGTRRIRTGEPLVFCKIVAVAPAQVRRDGRVQAKGSPVRHATLGPLEDWLEEKAGPGVIGGIAERAVLRERYVKGERERLLAAAFMIRVIVLMTLMPGAGVRGALTALAGDLAGVPWERPWVPASERALGDWRNALGPEPLEELQAVVLRASWQEHEDRDWRAVIIGRNRPLKASSLDGTLIRVPDTPGNRAVFGSVGTGDDSSPYPQVRALPLTDASTRGLLGMPHGPAGTDKAAAEQKLLDTAMRDYPHLFADDGAGQRVQAREISHSRTRRAVLAAIRAGKTSCTALARELAKHRTIIDRNRHRARKAKCASTFPRAGRAGTATRIAAAVITLANTPA